MNVFDNLFYLFGYKRNNEKYFFNSRPIMLGAKGPIYLNVETPYELYNSIAELRAPIDILAAMFSNCVLHIEDKKTLEILDEKYRDVLNLLENPNLLQSQNDWMNQYLRQLNIYGNQFIVKNQPSSLSKIPISLNNASPRYVKPVLTGKFYKQVDIESIIEKYNFCENGIQDSFQTKDVMWSKIADLDSPLIGCSPLKSLQYPLTNTKLAYDYLNVISGDKGAIGMLSTSQKDSMGAIPMLAEEKEKIESSYRNTHGIQDGKQRIHVTNGTVTWTPMTYPTSDLLLLEQIDNNFLRILFTYGVNPNIFMQSTYDNLKHGMIMTYQNTIFPFADGFTQLLSKFLNLPSNVRIVADYSHIAILKNDETQDVGNLKTRVDAITQLVNASIITPQQGQQIIQKEESLVFDPATNSISDRLSVLSPLVANSILGVLTINEQRAMAGLPPVANGDVIPTVAPPAF